MQPLILEEYKISSARGFLPTDHPLTRLPTYYDEWESICSDLHGLRVRSALTAKVAQLALLTTDFLRYEAEWRRAYVLLGFITNAYVWGPEVPLARLPVSIAVPFIAVSEHLEMPPVATYGAENLWNYRPLDPRLEIDNPENFDALTTFTGLPDESWFFAIPAAIEARGAPIIPLILDAFHAVSVEDSDQLTNYLQDIGYHIDALSALLPRMYERCNPQIFYSKIRPFLSGTMSTQLPHGIFYEEGDGKGSHRLHKGPTAAQSSLFHLLDIALSVRHRPIGVSCHKNGHPEEDPGPEDNFLKEMRQHMPGDHRRFLEDVPKIANIRPYVVSHPQHAALQDAYNACLANLATYRNKHIQIVSRYIVIPSRAAAQSAVPQTEIGTAGRVLASDEALPPQTRAENVALGTGGTAPMEFLKQVRDETRESSLKM